VLSRLLTPALASLALLGCTEPAPAPEPVPPQAETPAPDPTPQTQDEIIFVPTPPSVVTAMLELAGVDETDIVYDLGSGDGRIAIAAAEQFGARAVGIEIDPRLVRDSEVLARAAGVDDRVQFLAQDLFDTDISAATVVTLYLLPSLNARLPPKLNAELAPGTPVVSHAFGIGDVPPERTVEVNGRTIYLWTVPLR
jgi:SAM-dependent methyltransferase